MTPPAWHADLVLTFGLAAVVNMDTLVVRYGPAPVSFLIVPVIGAFFIDFSNPLIITAAIWILR